MVPGTSRSTRFLRKPRTRSWLSSGAMPDDQLPFRGIGRCVVVTNIVGSTRLKIDFQISGTAMIGLLSMKGQFVISSVAMPLTV